MFKHWPRAGIVLAFSSMVASAAVSVSLTPSVPTSAVGKTVIWTTSASDSSNANATLVYQYSVGMSSALQIVRAYSSDPTFAWTPSGQEGTYTVQVSVSSSSGATGSASASYNVTSLITGSTPVVSSTNHPLVALYSVPPCPAGEMARVRFTLLVGGAVPSNAIWQTTSSKACNGSTSLNFYVAGMRASSTYQLVYDLLNGQQVETPDEPQNFPTSAIASGVVLPPTTITQAASAPNNTAYPIVLTFPAGAADPIATDVQNNLLWYLPGFETNGGYLFRAVPGGTFLGAYDDTTGGNGNRHLLREWDLAGNVVRETSVTALNMQLTAVGEDSITSFSHEAYRLLNGDTAIIGTVEKLAPQGTNNANVDVLGDMAIVLDSNLQVKWWWNEFEHLNIHRLAVLGETCSAGVGGCPVLRNGGTANDWTHSNSLAPTPDGNLIISIRHQDWVIKLNYQNGTVPAWTPGQPDNTMIWTFGNEGSFTTTASDPNDTFPWPSHQHDVEFAPNGVVTLFDNGNTRVHEFPGEDSRGQAWVLNETNLTATRVFNQDLGVYSQATGVAELMSNGNYHFYIGFDPGTDSESVEYNTADGTYGSLQFAQSLPTMFGYRSFRLASLYSEYPAAGQYFIPVTPCRLVDTRNANGAFGGPSLSAGATRSFGVPFGSCGIPQSATAYSVNVTAVPHGVLGFLSVWPDGQPQPNVSTLNSWDGRVKANAAIVPAGNAGAVDIYASGDTDLILDVNGYFEPTPGLDFYPTNPCRVFDSRNANGPFGGPSLGANEVRQIAVQDSACSVPSGAQAYSLNITAVPKTASLGYLTIWPSGATQPYVSTLNSYTGVTTANAAIVPGGTNGDISVFVTNSADVVVDINGYFAPSSSNGLLLYPLTPCRVVDTRQSTGAFSGVLSPTFNTSCGVPSAAQALVLNATVVPVGPLGYLSLWEAGMPQPYVSTLNSYDGSVISNMAIVPASSGLIEAYTSNATQLILDVSAYFAP